MVMDSYYRLKNLLWREGFGQDQLSEERIMGTQFTMLSVSHMGT